MSRTLQVHLLPELVDPDELRDGVAVVIDVLRATTTIIHALAAGATSVFPCGEIDDARRAAEACAAGTVVLGGERQGVKISGFDFGNSPTEYTPDKVKGKTLVFTTTNGTRALLRAQRAERVFAAGFANLHAVVQLLVSVERPVHIICAGTDGRITLEDCLCAGAIAAGFAEATGSPLPPDDQTLLTTTLFESRGRQHAAQLEAMRISRGGSNLIDLGFVQDIETAAQWDQFDIVPELLRDPWRMVPAHDAHRIQKHWLKRPDA